MRISRLDKKFLSIWFVLVVYILSAEFSDNRDCKTEQPGKNETFTAEALATPPENIIKKPVPNISQAIPVLEQEKAEDSLDKALITILTNFKGNAAQVEVQIKLIEALISYFNKAYADLDPESLLNQHISAVFPDLADEIHNRFLQLRRYNEWLEENRSILWHLSGVERENALWSMRISIFGDAADIIWKDSLCSMKIYDAMEFIHRNPTLDFEQQAAFFEDAAKQKLSDKNDGENSNARFSLELLSIFLNLENVQAQLHDMDDEERRLALRAVRRQMGLSEKMLDRFESLDQKREKRRQEGIAYMLAREEIKYDLKGEQLENELDRIRNRFFGEEAEILKAEELSGFYRYTDRQIYGLN